MKSEPIELPVACSGPADDLWRIELEHSDGGTGYADNVPRTVAELLLRNWRAKVPGCALFCSRCPTGPVVCPHDDRQVFPYAEITNMRIMPMREAI